MTTQTQAGDGIVRPDTRVKLYWAKNDNLVLIGRHLHHVTRSPDQLFTAIMLPATLPLFRFVCGGAIDVGTTSLIGHLDAALFRAAISLVTMVGLGLAVGSAPPAPSSTRVPAAGALLLFAFSLAGVVAVLGLVARSADGAGGLGMILMFSPTPATPSSNRSHSPTPEPHPPPFAHQQAAITHTGRISANYLQPPK